MKQMRDASFDVRFSPIILYALEKPMGQIRRFVTPYLRRSRASTIKVSKSWGKYASLAPTVAFILDFDGSPITLYFGS